MILVAVNGISIIIGYVILIIDHYVITSRKQYSILKTNVGKQRIIAIHNTAVEPTITNRYSLGEI